MLKNTKKIRLLLSFFLLFMIVGTSLLPALAADKPVKKVRVGYYEEDTAFQDGFTDDARKSGYAYEYYQKIATLTGWNYQYVYGSKEEIYDKLLTGEVDIVAGVYKSEFPENQVLFSTYDMNMDGEPCYFAFPVSRKELADELNEAQETLFSNSPNYTANLRQKYYNPDTSQQMLTPAEKEFLAQMGSLDVGYVRNNLPLSDQSDDGTPIGIVAELLSMVSDYLEIPLNPVCYDTLDLMEEGLRKGEVDIAFPMYSDLWLAETNGFFQTDSFISGRVMIIYQGDERKDLMDKVALSRTGVGQRYYLSIYYPDSETVYYDNREKAFEAVKRGEADCMIGYASIILNFLSEHTEYQDFNIAYLDAPENFCIAVNQGECQLVEIMNKAVHQLNDAIITNAMLQYANVDEAFTFKNFIRHYAGAVIAVLCFFFTLLLWTFLNFRRKTRLFNAEQARTRVALEAALDAANTASVAKTTFLSNMSHDIRTPMNGIIGMTAIAAAHMDDPARVRDCLEKITASGKHLLALINEVLDMSKIESGTIHLNEEAFDLSALMDDLIILNRPLAEAKNQELVVHILNISHEEVIGDGLRLQQIFTNLTSNAVKYTPDGGTIEITLSEKPSGSPKLGCFELIVKDNGVGMSEEYLPHVFDAFTREKNATFSQGTGLGMPIARNIARMMDGDITVESTLGEGSKFTVTFLLKLPDTEHASYEDFIGLPILVVDDDPVICESTCLLLSELGMNGESVLSGRDAIEKVDSRHKEGADYFAVLIDWQMPDMDGVTTTREIRKRLGNDVPIIIISAYDWSTIEAEAIRAGANGFIGKPLFKSRIAHLFGQLVGHNQTEEKSSNPGLKELTAQTDFTGKRALLAEDNELNAEIAIEILSMTGLSVDWAKDGKEAVTKMDASAPGYYDCIFMDVQMPVMNGIDATKAIRILPRPDARTIPVFAMTANAFAEDVQAVLSAGMNEHIAKPLNFDVLIKILNDYLGENASK